MPKYRVLAAFRRIEKYFSKSSFTEAIWIVFQWKNKIQHPSKWAPALEVALFFWGYFFITSKSGQSNIALKNIFVFGSKHEKTPKKSATSVQNLEHLNLRYFVTPI